MQTTFRIPGRPQNHSYCLRSLSYEAYRNRHVLQLRVGVWGQVGRVEIGYVGSAAFFGVLQEQVQRFRNKWPDVMLNTKELPTEQILPLLEEGRIDLAFVRTPVHLPLSVSSHVMARDRFCVALPADHALSKMSTDILPRALSNESFVIPEQGLGLREVARRGKFD